MEESKNFFDKSYTRSELFSYESEELQDYIQKHNISVNPYLSDDYITLKKHYSIVLEYVKSLENKLRYCRYELEKNENKPIISNIIDSSNTQKDVSSEIKSLKCEIAGLRSSIVREKKKRENAELLLHASVKTINELKTTIKLLKKKKEKKQKWNMY